VACIPSPHAASGGWKGWPRALAAAPLPTRVFSPWSRFGDPGSGIPPRGLVWQNHVEGSLSEAFGRERYCWSRFSKRRFPNWYLMIVLCGTLAPTFRVPNSGPVPQFPAPARQALIALPSAESAATVLPLPPGEGRTPSSFPLLILLHAPGLTLYRPLPLPSWADVHRTTSSRLSELSFFFPETPLPSARPQGLSTGALCGNRKALSRPNSLRRVAISLRPRRGVPASVPCEQGRRSTPRRFY